MDILDTIKEYGNLYYAIVFAWTFLEGETFVIFSGVAARQGILDLGTLIACAWLGAFLGDQVYFTVGRRWGKRLVVRYPRFAPAVNKAMRLLERHATLFILTFRFIYGVRNVSSFACGMSDIAWSRFAFLNFFAAGLWAVSFAGTGYLAGAALQHVLGDAVEGFGLIMLGLFLCVGVWLFHRSRKAPASSPAD